MTSVQLRTFSADVNHILKRDAQSLRTSSALFTRLAEELGHLCDSSTSRFSLEHELQVSSTLREFGDKLRRPGSVDALPNAGFQSLGGWCQRFSELIDKLAAARQRFNQSVVEVVLPALHTVKNLADASVSSSDAYLVSSNFLSLEDMCKAKSVSKSGFVALGQCGVDEIKRVESRSVRCLDSCFQSLSVLSESYHLLYAGYAADIDAVHHDFEEFRAAFSYPPVSATVDGQFADIARQLDQPAAAAKPSNPVAAQRPLPSTPTGGSPRTSPSPSPSPSPTASPSPLSSLPRGRAASLADIEPGPSSTPPLLTSTSTSSLKSLDSSMSCSSPSSSSPLSSSSSLETSPPPQPSSSSSSSSQDEEFFKNRSRAAALDAPARVLSQRRKLLLGKFLTAYEAPVVSALTFVKDELLGALMDSSSKAAHRFDAADRDELNALVLGMLSFHMSIVAESQRALDTWTEQSSVGPLFVSFHIARHYERYLERMPELIDGIDKARKDSKMFHSFCRKVEEAAAAQGGASWSSLRWLLFELPVSVLRQYEDLMAASNDQTRADDPNRQVLLNAFLECSKLEQSRAEYARRYEQKKVVASIAKTITGLPAELQALASSRRALVKEGPAQAVEPGGKRRPVHLFMLSDVLVETGRQQRVVGAGGLQTRYQFSRSFDLTHCAFELAGGSGDGDATRWNLVLPPRGEGFEAELVPFASESPAAWGQAFAGVVKYWDSHRAFAVPLKTLMKNPHNHLHDIPTVVSALIADIIARGLRCEGIFRMSGAKREVDRIRHEFDTTGAASLASADVHSVAVALKQWLRELPDQLVPTHVQDRMLAVMTADHTVAEQIATIRTALAEIPTDSQFLLQHIVSFLALIAAHQEHNKMTIANLAIVFAPSIIQRDITSAAQQDVVFKLFHVLITNYDDIFIEIEQARRLLREKLIASESFLNTN